VSAGNEGIRTIGGMVLACATVLKYDDSLSNAQRQAFLGKATAALRYLVATHVTGKQKCMDGKPWGATPKFGAESWQSGMWTGTIAFGAWLIWDKLDPQLQDDLQRVVASEDDILAARKPPNNLWGDTKAEENGWEVPILVLGELMFPKNPHAAAWHEAAIKYMMNTLCTEADTHDAELIDGRPVQQWVGGANLQPDFTLENHNIFHPSYVACSSYFLTQAQMYYTFADKPIPQSAMHHSADTWHMFQSIILPWGEVAYPQGMDWELHGLPYVNLFAAMATHDKDAFASCMEQHILQYIRAWQKMGDGSSNVNGCNGGGDTIGSLAFPGSKFGIARHSINAEQTAYGLLAHKIFGPSVEPLTASQAATLEVGVHDYPYVDFITHRTDKKFVSFSWKNRIMGMLIPIGDGHEDNPAFTVPIQNGFIGSFDLAPSADKAEGKAATKPADTKMKVLEHSRLTTPNFFQTTGTLLLNGGRLKQTLRLTSIGSQTVIYEDHVTALSDVTIQSERGLPIGIENDPITGNHRLLTDAHGQTTFEWNHPQQPVAIDSPWANIDSRLSIIPLAGSGMRYAQATGYSPGISVCTDILYGSFSNSPRTFKAGDEVAHRIAVLFAEVSPTETTSLAQSCKLEASPDGETLRFQQPDGKEVQLKGF
jgi:hypothetical protein